MSLSKGPVVLAVLCSLGFPVTLLAADAKTSPAKPTAPQATKPTAAQAPKPVAAPVAKLTAKQIVQKHLDARGGLQAWHGVQSMSWNGTMEVGYGDSVARSGTYVNNAMARKGKGPRTPPGDGQAVAQKQVQVPFLLEVKRPAKSRIEIEFAGKTAVQLYDGTHGWLRRPYLNRDGWEPFSAEQARSQQGKWELGGPLIDHADKDTKVELVSVDQVDGHAAYKLKLTRKGGEVQHVWIDAKSFLDVKVEGTPRRMDGQLRTVWITERDFRPVQGLMVPFVLETAVDGSPGTHKMIIDKVALNPPLDDGRFAKPRT